MEFVDHLKASVDIVKVVGEYVRLKKIGGTGRYTGLCPFHTEKTPSFGVNATHQFYKCFGCNAGGDVLKFVMEIERISFPEALKLLAERNGIPMPRRTEYADPEAKQRASLAAMHEIAARVFEENLRSRGGAEARDYLAKRGVTAEQAGEFGLGLSDASGNGLLRRLEQDGFAADLIEASGLVSKRQDGSGYFDRFRARLMFPIHNETGKIIAFAGRALRSGDEPKYLNSPETPLYHKTYVLYNLHRAKDAVRKGERAVLVEGYMDAIGLYTAGIREVVASCGTALTPTQVRGLKRHAESVVVNFDPDAAGSNAAERSIQMLLDESIRVRVLELDQDLDPDEYVKQNGAEAYRARLDKAPGYFEWLAGRARKRFDIRSGEGRRDALKFLLPSIQRVSDKLERAAITGEVAELLGVEQGLVLEQFRRVAVERRGEVRARPASSAPPIERILLRSILADEDTGRKILPRLAEIPAVGRFHTCRIFETLVNMGAAGERVQFAGLEARLAENDRALLHEVISADEMGDESAGLEPALACVETLASLDREARIRDLKESIKRAEREGSLKEALQGMEELTRLEKQWRR